MRKIFIIWTSLFITAPLVLAQSTCQTCSKKTTKDKTPEVVSYVIITKKQARRSTPKARTPRTPSAFKRNKLLISRFYVTTDYFPLWENDILSEQEVLARQKEQLQGVRTNENSFGLGAENWAFAAEDNPVQPQDPVQSTHPNVHGVLVSTPKINTDSFVSGSLQQPTTTNETFDEANDFFYEQQQSVQQAYDQFNQNVNQAANQFQDNVNQAWQDADQYFYDQQQPVQQAYDQFNQNVNQAANQFQDNVNQAWQDADQYFYDQQQPVQQAYDQFNQNANQAADQFQDNVNQAWQDADQYFYDQQQPVQQAYDQFNQNVNQAADQFQDGVNQARQDANRLSNDWEY